MSTTPTRLPVPSEKPQDLKFNSGKIDEFVTSLQREYEDRFGNKHYTIEGLRWVAQKAIAAFGYITLKSFQLGVPLPNNELTLPNQVLQDETDGEYYRWDGVFPKAVPAGSTPNSTGGVGVGAWLSTGDAVLRGELSSSTGSMLIPTVDIQFNSLKEALLFSSYNIGKKVKIGGYNINSDGGASSFEVVSIADPIGILTHDGNFKLKRMSGHDFYATLVRNGSTPRVVAHRGWSGTTTGEFPGSGLTAPIYFVPENTRASIRFASERGVWGIEGDTKISSDGVPVIFHDATVDRVTNNVNTGAIESFTYAQLKAMDVGTYVSSAWANERIMNYDEWLRECKRCAVTPLAEWSAPMTSDQADNFLSLVTKYYGSRPTDVCVQSTYPQTLELLRSKNAYIGLCVMGAYGAALDEDRLNMAYKLGNCAAMLSGPIITDASAVSSIKDRGLLLVYAIANTPTRFDNAVSAGADIIVTDFYRG
ncbi:glycerophosphodiester phosphodiesterase family protein [Kluyvera sichuanensis]|uniref:glycerophosphodiester phosphodiesterase family protein n=1 Tax=Kluyvera sichuanensis TaxID=2725494 RepID=UPI0034A18FC2